MRILLMIVALIMSISMSAQNLVINLVKDDMTDEVYPIVNVDNVVANAAQTVGVVIRPYITIDTDDMLACRGLSIEDVGLGGCIENAELIIKFEDGTSITITSWNEFNCDNRSYFRLTKANISLLSTKVIDKIRFTNGYTYDSITNTPVSTTYFVKLYQVIEEWNSKQH